MPLLMLRGMTEDDLVFEGDLEEDKWYRRVRDTDTAHLWSGHGVDTHCGLSLWLDEAWWAASIWEQELGEQWLISENREKGKKCVECVKVRAQTWKAYTVTTQAWQPPPSQRVWPSRWWSRQTHTSQSSPSHSKLLHSWSTVCGWEDPSAPF